MMNDTLEQSSLYSTLRVKLAGELFHVFSTWQDNVECTLTQSVLQTLLQEPLTFKTFSGDLRLSVTVSSITATVITDIVYVHGRPDNE